MRKRKRGQIRNVSGDMGAVDFDRLFEFYRGDAGTGEHVFSTVARKMRDAERRCNRSGIDADECGLFIRHLEHPTN